MPVVENLLRQAQDLPLSKSLSSTLRAAVRVGDTRLVIWARLELLGYVRDNPAMTDDTVVPEYRSVTGDWLDEFGRQLTITDPRLAFVNEIRLRFGVPELESLVGNTGVIALRLPDFSEVIREHLNVEVSIFRFSPQSASQVLGNIRAQLLDRLATHRSDLEQVPPDRLTRKMRRFLSFAPTFMGLAST